MRANRVTVSTLTWLVALAATALFVPSLSGEFLNWDDTVGLVRNEAYRGLGWPQIRWDFTNTYVGHYMPLTWLSFGVSYVVASMEPPGYHAVNVLLHGVNAAVFLLIAVRLLGAAAGRRCDSDPRAGAADRHPAPAVVAGATLAALLFAVHPQRVEPVAWITGRSTVLSGFFYLVAVLGYLRATEGGPARWKWAGAGSVGAFVAAVLAHPIAMTLPVSLLVLDVYPLRRRRPWPDLLREKAPYAAVACVAGVLAVLARQRGVLWTPDASRDLGSRILFAAESLWFDFSTLKEPYRIEGKKTMGLELAEQLGWELPDAIFYPTGGGTGLIGMWKAFDEMEAVGLIGSKRPRMYAVQAEGCAPMVRAFERGDEFAERWEHAATVATGIRVPKAVGDFLILRAVRDSGGGAIAVPEQAILQAVEDAAQKDGFLLCPEGGAVLAAWRQALERGLVSKDERVLLFNCANGNKYPLPDRSGRLKLAEADPAALVGTP